MCLYVCDSTEDVPESVKELNVYTHSIAGLSTCNGGVIDDARWYFFKVNIAY